MSTVTKKKVEHGSKVFQENSSCHCKICESKKKAVERMVETMSYIPYGWLEHVKEALGEGFGDPMWGTIWLAGDNKGCFESIMKEYEYDWEKLEEEEGEECATLIGDGWRELGDSGVFAREFDGELLVGIHGAGYNFYSEHWEKLYDEVGYLWHTCE